MNIVIAHRLGAAGSFGHMPLREICCLEFWNRKVCDVGFTLFLVISLGNVLGSMVT